MSERQDVTKKMAGYLQQKFIEFQQRSLARGSRLPSQNEFIKWLGVEQTSFSNWVNGIRPPSGENVDKLAAKLGPEVYDILETPPRMPSDRYMRIIAMRWHKLSEAKRRELAERVQNEVDDFGGEVKAETQ